MCLTPPRYGDINFYPLIFRIFANNYRIFDKMIILVYKLSLASVPFVSFFFHCELSFCLEMAEGVELQDFSNYFYPPQCVLL